MLTPQAGWRFSATSRACAAARPSPPISRRSSARTGSSMPSRPSPGRKRCSPISSRYTHRVAIANSRLIALDERGVTFRYKDYRRDGQARYSTMTLAADEFIRRYLLHVLPKGFHRIRHYGLLASPGCKANVAHAKELIAAPMPEVEPPTAHDTADLAPGATSDHRPPCPCCGGHMLIVEVFGRGGAPRGPPSRPASRDNPCRLGAATIRRNSSFPAPCPFQSGIGKCRHDIIDQPPIKPSATLAGAEPQSSAALSPHQPAQNHPPPTPLPDQRCSPPSRGFVLRRLSDARSPRPLPGSTACAAPASETLTASGRSSSGK